MPERKSGRARKSVDYTRFGGDDNVDDDDFADATPPMSKRAKLSNKENVQNVNEKKNAARKDPKKRSTIEEKMFERELQAALELSMSQSDPSQETEAKTSTSDTETSKVSPSIEDPPNKIDTPSNIIDAPPDIISAPPDIIDNQDRAPSPILPKIENPPVLHKFGLEVEGIEVLAENVKDVPASKRRTTKPKKYVDSDSDSGDGDFEIDLRKFLRSPLTPKCKKRKKNDDSDFAPGAGDVESDASEDESDNDSDEDFNDDDSDSDFGVSKKKPAKKASTSTPKQTKAKQPAAKTGKTTAVKTTVSKAAVIKSPVTNLPPKKTTVTNLPVTKVTKPASVKTTVRPVTKHSPVVTSPVSRAPASGLTKKTPNWNPPGQAGMTKSPLGGVTLKSPSSGLRIGLSRNMKLKPLHPNVKMAN